LTVAAGDGGFFALEREGDGLVVGFAFVGDVSGHVIERIEFGDVRWRRF
jgi:hypothetical protein